MHCWTGGWFNCCLSCKKVSMTLSHHNRGLAWCQLCRHWRRDKLSTTCVATIRHSDVIMSAMASQITGVLIVYSTVCSCADQRKHKKYASLAFVRRVHRWPVNSPHKGQVKLKYFHLMTSSWLTTILSSWLILWELWLHSMGIFIQRRQKFTQNTRYSIK